MPERNFNDRRRAQERVTFILGPDDHRFSCKMRIAPEALLEYEALAPDALNDEAIGVMDRLVAMVLQPDDVPIFQALRDRDDDETIELAELADLCGWLVEQVVNRPLDQPSSSSDTPSSTGTPSTVVPLSPAAQASTG